MKILDTIQRAATDLRNLAKSTSDVAQAIGEGFRMLERMFTERQVRHCNIVQVRMTWGEGKNQLIFGRLVAVLPGGSRTLTFINERATIPKGKLILYSSGYFRITGIQLGNRLMPVEGHVQDYEFQEEFPIGARIGVTIENLILEEK